MYYVGIVQFLPCLYNNFFDCIPLKCRNLQHPISPFILSFDIISMRYNNVCLPLVNMYNTFSFTCLKKSCLKIAQASSSNNTFRNLRSPRGDLMVQSTLVQGKTISQYQKRKISPARKFLYHSESASKKNFENSRLNKYIFANT